MQSVPLWCDYLNFVQERDQLVSQCTPAGVLKMRNLFERALTAAGLHIAEGSKIWEAYREYEQAIFLTIDDDNNEVSIISKSDIKHYIGKTVQNSWSLYCFLFQEKSKQVHRIHALFHRQLSVPLVDLKSTLENYKVWEVEKGDTSDANLEVDEIPSNIVSAYKKALEMYNARRMHEDHLSRSDASDADRLQSFMV